MLLLLHADVSVTAGVRLLPHATALMCLTHLVWQTKKRRVRDDADDTTASRIRQERPTKRQRQSSKVCVENTGVCM